MHEYVSVNFFDVSVWRSILLIGLLLLSLLLANTIKRTVPFFKNSLIPNSVLGGIILLIISTICYFVKGEYLLNLDYFAADGAGINILEVLTYHCLAIGFIAMTLRPTKKAKGDGRGKEILNSGITTIGTYLIQGFVGLIFTLIAYFSLDNFAPGSGILMALGYGQGTGQALSIGKAFDFSMGTTCYSSFGLAMAALGFLTASIVGVIYLNHLRRHHLIDPKKSEQADFIEFSTIQGTDEVPMTESVDKLTVEVALVAISYILAYGFMYLVGNVIIGTESNMIGTVYGFNFFFGVLSAVIVKGVMNFLRKKGIIHREYLNTFLLNRISGFAFDLMIVSGICAIQIHVIQDYVGLILLLAVSGAVITFIYLRFVTSRLFKNYEHEQFLAWFGMLTGTASTGMILLREADPQLKTPVSENLVYQNFPAIILGAPFFLIAGKLTNNADNFQTAVSMFIVIIVFFIILNIFLFRDYIFKKKKAK